MNPQAILPQPVSVPEGTASRATSHRPARTLRVLDLFSGIGGFSLGLSRAGRFETVRFCEIEPFCRRLLAKRFPGVPCSEDVTLAQFEEGEADVIVGGFPCQDLSNAGRRAGLSGSRSGLYRDLVRAIRVVRPRWAVLENVAALLGRGMGTVLGDLAESGYDTEWDCLPASAVGAPHQRDRVWIVAHPRGEQHEGKGDAFRRALTAGLPEAFDRNTGLPAWVDAEAHAQRSDADSIGPYRTAVHVVGGVELRDEQDGQSGSVGELLADAICVRQQGPGQPVHASNPAAARQGQAGDAVDGRVRGQWATEPDVGRVAYGVPAQLDGAIGHAEELSSEGSAESDGKRDRLSGLRGAGAFGEASPRLRQAPLGGGSLSALSREGGLEGWNQEGQAAEKLHDLWDGVHPHAQQEAHDLQRSVSRGSGASERSEAVGWWGAEPDVPRVAVGVPNRVDRLRGLGNAVVPQIPELIGRAILQAEEAA